MTSDKRLSLAEFRDELTWPQLQLVVYKIILGLWFFLDLKVKRSAILIFKVIFICQKLTEFPSDFFSTEEIEKGHIFITLILNVIFHLNVCPIFDLQKQKDL